MQNFILIKIVNLMNEFTLDKMLNILKNTQL